MLISTHPLTPLAMSSSSHTPLRLHLAATHSVAVPAAALLAQSASIRKITLRALACSPRMSATLLARLVNAISYRLNEWPLLKPTQSIYCTAANSVVGISGTGMPCVSTGLRPPSCISNANCRSGIVVKAAYLTARK